MDDHINIYPFLLKSKKASGQPLFEMKLISETSLIIPKVAVNGLCDEFLHQMAWWSPQCHYFLFVLCVCEKPFSLLVKNV